MTKPVFSISNPVRHKLDCTAREDGLGFDFFIKRVDGIISICSENKGVDQLCSNYTADLLLCFCICKNACFSHEVVHIVLKRRRQKESRSTIFECSVIQGSKDLIRLIKKLWLGSNTSQPLFKAPFGYTGLALSFHYSVVVFYSVLPWFRYHFVSSQNL